jgi:hypothetical protein
MSVTRGTSEGVYGELNPQDLRDMAKAEQLEARFQGFIADPPRKTTPLRGQRRQDIVIHYDLDARWAKYWLIEYLPAAEHLALSQGKER